ncbi:hypothetical protein [Cryobacterium sp. PH29-G1]|uniref:hypothetical protein n=1 Tax=Cryobacterium sp. PH29-G1 TaxID=3046211 RepID=UPI0024B98EBF|nr:hypothetical protein [Cryobacterium sp. PH29-G1]MDJ0350962.1 hypothetical protein [Cryobacterium sp. PH29-G1]
MTVPRSDRMKRFLTAFWVPIVLVMVALGVSGTVAVVHTDQMSPVDEWVYIDYLEKLPTQGIVHRGEDIGAAALDQMACSGVKIYGPMGPPCGSDYEAHIRDFPYQGQTSADLYTPIYFGATWVVGGAIHLLTGTDQVTSWRLTGALWQALSMVLMFFLFRLWNVRPLATLALGLAVIASPFSWWTYSYVNTDAPSFALGVLLLLATTKFIRGHWSGWWIVAVSALAMGIKATNILGICAVGLYLVVQWLYERRSITWRGLKTTRPELPARSWFALPGFALAAGAAGAVVTGVWTVIRSMVALTDSPDQGTTVPFGPVELTDQLINFLPNTIAANVDLVGTTALAYPVPAIMSVPLTFLTVAGVIGAFWTLRKGSAEVPVVTAIAIASIVAAPFLALVLFTTQGAYFPLPPRYGASILGGMLLLAGMTMRFRPAIWATLAYSAGLTVVVLATAAHYG